MRTTLLACTALALVFATPAGAQTLPGARRMAVIVGSNAAPPGRRALRYAADDARSVGAALIDVAGFAPDDVDVLVEPNPSTVLATLRRRMQQLSAILGAQRFLAEIEPADVMREGLGMAEAFRGDVLVWVRLEGERVARCHLRDPSWFQWPLLEAVIEGNIVADFPLCNKSFNCSYSGHDL